ncbi:hypothetical protein CY658_28935 [Variovorax sp. RO1]|uniref:PcfJ domain-containing protein n=1 Tax=Variovorax sp. RO1 TaxID=2066034 RepID=UPI000C718716|nr:PcfJ domain-containing protein [Variovorax sp. RO1]PLC02035.1 hypothetical protein CY658_28935 [Variovorax sp. RO1]
MPIPTSPPSTSPSAPPAATAVYLPRDVVNAPEVKAAIARRSAERGDDADMAAWLLNHFFRWAIGSFGNVLPVQSPADYLAAAGPDKPLPEWLAKQLQPRAPVAANAAAAQDKDKSKSGKADPQATEASSKTFYYLDPEHLLLVDRERMLVEFLRSRRGTRLEQKLQRITCFMAMALWEQEHQRMQAKRNKGWVPSSGLALKELLRTPNGVIFEFIGSHAALREEMAYESFHMQHCLGQFANLKKLNGGYGEQYASAAQSGRLRLFTLRSAGNLPHVTISLEVHADGLRVDQIKGKQNRHPVRKYADDVLQFLRTLPPRGQRHSDCEGMGLVFEPETADDTSTTQGQWKFVTDVRSPDFLLSVMSGNFHLIEHFEQPPPALQWLLLRIAPHELARLRQMDVAVAAAARLTLPANRLPPSLQAASSEAPAAMMEIEGISLSAAVCAPLLLGAASP